MDDFGRELEELKAELSPEQLEKFERYAQNHPGAGVTLIRLITAMPDDAATRSEDVHDTISSATADLVLLLNVGMNMEKLSMAAISITAIYWYGYQKGRASNLMFTVAEEEA